MREDSTISARDDSLRRVQRLKRAVLIGATLLAGAIAGLTAESAQTSKATPSVPNATAKPVTVVPTPVPAAAPSSAQVPIAPAQAPTQSAAPPVVSSGGS